MDKANEMFLCQYMNRITDMWEAAKVKLADKIAQWGGEVKLSDTIRFHDLWESGGKNWLRIYVVSSDEEDTKHLAQRFDNQFVQTLREDQTEFYKNYKNKIPAQDWWRK